MSKFVIMYLYFITSFLVFLLNARQVICLKIDGRCTWKLTYSIKKINKSAVFLLSVNYTSTFEVRVYSQDVYR